MKEWCYRLVPFVLQVSTAWGAGLYLEDYRGTIYAVRGGDVRIAESREGRRIEASRFAEPSFEIRSDGTVMAGLETGWGVEVLRIDTNHGTWSVVDRVRGADQPVIKDGILFYVKGSPKSEKLFSKRTGGPVDLLGEFPEIGGFAVTRLRGNYCVAFGATGGSTEQIMLVHGRPGAWEAPVPITDSWRDRYWPAVAVGSDGRLLVACVGGDAGEHRICILTEQPDGTFPETVVPLIGEISSSPELRGGLNPAVFWIASSAVGRRVLAAPVDSPFDIRVAATDAPAGTLTRLGRHFYGGGGVDLDAAVLDPAALPQYEPAPAAASGSYDAVSFDRYSGYGDSIMEGDPDRGDNADRAGFYPLWRDELNRIYGYAEVFNDAKGGEQTDEGAARIDKILTEHMPGIVCFMEGTNDVTGRRGNYTSARTTANLLTMAQKIRAIGAIPIISTIIPRTQIDVFDPNNKKTRQWNRSIRKMANENGIAKIGMYRVFIKSRNWQSNLMKDDVHPSKEGYKLMGEKWLDAIRTYRPTP